MLTTFVAPLTVEPGSRRLTTGAFENNFETFVYYEAVSATVNGKPVAVSDLRPKA